MTTTTHTNQDIQDHRTAALAEALSAIHAQQIASHPMKMYAGKGRFEVYLLPSSGRIFVIQFQQMRKDDPESWEVLVPVCDSPSIDHTLDALKKWAQ